MITTGESRKQTSFAVWRGTLKVLGAHTAVAGTIDLVHRARFGWTMSIVSVMKTALQSAVMADGEVTTAFIIMMWAWSANIHHCQDQVNI